MYVCGKEAAMAEAKHKNNRRAKGDKTRDKILTALESYPHGTNLRILSKVTGIKHISVVHHHVLILREADLIAELDYEGQTNSIRLTD